MENLSRWDGTISSSEFRIAATTLSEKWKVINPEFPPWTWINLSYEKFFLYYCTSIHMHSDFSGEEIVLSYLVDSDLPANSLKVLSESKWTFITQEEHPLLNRPWYTLNPCGTSEWMASVSCIWYLGYHLLVRNHDVGLNVPLEMISDFHRVCTIDNVISSYGNQ
ncbi:hypothetical protein MKW92_018872 [Papaver armeniacum]|nr:hypothetical protein MKW92_018872 [Papaver armeniacum]